MRRDAASGITVIEVLVALSLLSVVAAALIGTFSLISRLNRDASIDVDYSRVVRGVTERVKVAWSDPARWDEDASDDEAASVDAFTRGINPACGAAILAPVDGSPVVRVLEIRCGVEGGGANQVYQVEFAQP